MPDTDDKQPWKGGGELKREGGKQGSTRSAVALNIIYGAQEGKQGNKKKIKSRGSHSEGQGVKELPQGTE